MEDKNKQEAKRWLAQAEDDLEAAKWESKGHFSPQACFLSQQSAEKALKAYLYLNGEWQAWGHATITLLELCLEYNPAFSKFRKSCRLLDRYYIPTRYPNGLPGGIPKENFTEEDADEGIKASEEIVKAIKFAVS